MEVLSKGPYVPAGPKERDAILDAQIEWIGLQPKGIATPKQIQDFTKDLIERSRAALLKRQEEENGA